MPTVAHTQQRLPRDQSPAEDYAEEWGEESAEGYAEQNVQNDYGEGWQTDDYGQSSEEHDETWSGKEWPKQMPRIEVFELPIRSGDDGLTLDITSTGLMILEIGEGAVQKHNTTAREDNKVKVNDVIVSVGVESDTAGMLTVMANTKQYTLEIVRPCVTKITVEKLSNRLGLNLRYTPGSRCMEIMDIFDGDVFRYNLGAPPELQVLAGCLIGGVNGASGSAKNMLRQLKKVTKVELTVLRVVSDKHILPLKRITV